MLWPPSGEAVSISANMTTELEELWKKLSFMEEEDESINLGRNSTEAVKEIGKNCLVMKVLAHRSIALDSLKKNLRKLVRGKKVMIEGGEQQWISFKYEQFPNFCNRCGLFSHDLRDCGVTSDKDNQAEQTTLQYGA